MSSQDWLNSEEGGEAKEVLERAYAQLVESGILHPENEEAKDFFKAALAGSFKESDSQAKRIEQAHGLINQFDAIDPNNLAERRAIEKKLEALGIVRDISIEAGERYDAGPKMNDDYIVRRTLVSPDRSGTFANVVRSRFVDRDATTFRVAEVDIYI